MDGFKDSTKVRYSTGGTVKKAGGGRMVARDAVSTRPTDAKGRRITDRELAQANRDVGSMTAAELRATRDKVNRGNRMPAERIPTDAEAARAMSPYKKGGSVGFNSKPMVGKGGLSAMPRGKKC